MSVAKSKRRAVAGLRDFYDGYLYPPIVCTLVLVGNLTALEVYFNILITLLVAVSLLLSDSLKPLLAPMCTYVFQLSTKHTPWYPTFSDFYYTGWRLPVILCSFALIISSLFAFIIRKKIYKKLSFKVEIAET